MSGALALVTNGQVVVGFGLSDSNGVYNIPDLAPGSYTVTITKRNFLTKSSTAVVVLNAITVANFVLIPMALPPDAIVGSLIRNKYLTQTDYIRVISWTASPGLCVSGYRIFRNGIQIAFVSASTFKYVDCNCNKKAFTYSVRAVNSFGQVSDLVNIVIGCP